MQNLGSSSGYPFAPPLLTETAGSNIDLRATRIERPAQAIWLEQSVPAHSGSEA